MNPPASPARTFPPEHVPPLDLAEYRVRVAKIVRARQQAAREAEEEGIKEGEAEARYHRLLAQAFAYYRTKEEMGVTEAEIRAKGTENVVEARLERHSAWVLRKSAEERIAQLEANRAMLRAEAAMSEGIEG